MRYNDADQPDIDELVEFYASVGWTSYTKDPDGLAAAIENSTYVVTCRLDGELVGLARALSDDVSIFYLQDVLVRPTEQRNGVGRELLDRCLKRFGHVRQRVLLTDGDAHQHHLYRSVGYSDVASLTNVPLHAFVAIDGVELS